MYFNKSTTSTAGYIELEKGDYTGRNSNNKQWKFRVRNGWQSEAGMYWRDFDNWKFLATYFQ
jgi:hypothetical protein